MNQAPTKKATKPKRTADVIAYEAGVVHLSQAVFTFQLTTKQFHMKMPKTRDGLIEYVNKFQANIEKLREEVGRARYQLTGSTGSA